MKKLHAILITLLLMLCTAQTAFADAAAPVADFVDDYWPILLIAVAVIAIAIIIKNVKKKR